MSKTRLLLVVSSFFSHGGAELRFLRYLPLLNQCDISVEVVSGTPKLKKFSKEDFDSDWRDVVDGTLISEIDVEGANVFQYKLPEKGAAKRSIVLLDQVIARCKDAKTKPDVIQVLLPLSTKAISHLQKIKKERVPIVYSYALAHTFSKNLVVQQLQKMKVRRVYRYYDCIIVASAVLKKLLDEIAPSASVKVIPNGVDINQFSPVIDQDKKLSIRSSLGLPQNATIIVSVGAIHPRKGTNLLVDAWSSLVKMNKDLHLLLIGPRYDQSREELRAFKKEISQSIANSQQKNNIHFAGQIENVADYLKASDIFVFPSKKEGMPNAVLEAMATGLPTVLTAFIGLSEDFGKAGQEYLLTERSSQAIAATIQSILNDSNLRSNLSNNARKWIIDTMPVQTSVQMHADLYHSLA